MADIELVIKIPEDSYKATCNGWMLPSDVENVVNAIKNGTPLPKGHGELIDANELDNDLKERQKSYEHDFSIRQPINEAIEAGIIIARTHVNNASTIIEADKEQEDGKIIDDENKMELIKNAKDISYIGKSFCDGFKEGLKEQ